MPDFLLLMHGDTTGPESGAAWEGYLAKLRELGAFVGGSSIGAGLTMRRSGGAAAISAALTGFVRVTATDLDAAQRLVEGNPVYEAGGTVEIRALPED